MSDDSDKRGMIEVRVEKITNSVALKRDFELLKVLQL